MFRQPNHPPISANSFFPVPALPKISTAEAVAVRQAEGRTYFQFLLTTLPGSIATVALTYQLPTQLSLQPKLHTFRQAGINQTLTKTVTDAAGEEIFRKTFEMADGEIVQ